RGIRDDAMRLAGYLGPVGQVVVVGVGVVEEPAFLDHQAARVRAEASRVPAERPAARQAREALDGATHVRALDLLAHELIVEPAPAVAHDFVPGLDDGGGSVRVSLERHGHGEYADLDAVLGEDAHEAPEPRAGPVLVHRLDLKVAHALDRKSVV